MSENTKTIGYIRRIASYYEAVLDLISLGDSRVTSAALSDITGIAASQIRRDLQLLSNLGQSGYGYDLIELAKLLRRELSLDKPKKMIILGMGNIGRALINYKGFKTGSFKIIAAFDRNPNKIGKIASGIEIFNINTLNRYLLDHEVDIAILAIHHSRARQLARVCAVRGVKGLWNFTSKQLTDIDDLVVENVRLNESLYTLCALIGDKDNIDEKNLGDEYEDD
ncbi:MAG: redox-sensing transcriptional repressor Rex [Ezakiella sp.]|nr:redox-sensing transcriptional repressor Rex [Ezakiella sp.]MDY3947625.1 redox-sensing transcriptional repressor Rex [Ezakiella sp.]